METSKTNSFFCWLLRGFQDFLLSCRGCLLLLIASRSCFVTTVTDDRKKKRRESGVCLFLPEAGLWFLCTTTERISKNCWLARCNVQRQSWAADARFPPGYLTHDLVCISAAFSCTSAHFTHLLTADRTHTVAQLHPLTVRVWLAAGQLIPTLLEPGV